MPSDPSEEERIAELLSLLSPAPPAWVQAARERPRLALGLEQVLALAHADAEFRRELGSNLEAALERAGVDTTPELKRAVQAQLARDTERGDG
jgi:hypothetical protein